ncbi:hypothetical protein [Actinomadura sp. NPDC048394]|uniref:hypothetical protein n=1 Tax=Actinomadura sp. NPDC048394 TaxID=3158223 RepID=UPI003406A94B
MAGHEYSAADITVVEFDEAVRKRPGMYFGVGLRDPRLPAANYFEYLNGAGWWLMAAVMALCERVVVEEWQDGHAFRQELVCIRPRSVPERIEAPPGSGIRVVFALDPEYVGHGMAFPADLGHLDLHGSDCAEPEGPGRVVVRDLRVTNSTQEQEVVYR